MAGVRRTIGWCSGVAIIAGLLTIPAGVASADPVLNAAAKYVINVPGDVLEGSAGTMTEAAQLAAGQTFNWDFAESQFAQVSGDLTATPADPATVLSAPDLATFTGDVATSSLPAIKAAGVVKTAGVVGVALLMFDVGAKIGEAGSRLFGFKDDQVCAQRSDVLTGMAGVLDGVDCSGFNNALAKAQRNLDKHRPLFPDTCVPGVGCWTFVHQEPNGTAGALYNVFNGPCITQSVVYSVNGGTTSTDLNHLTSLSPYGCPRMQFGSEVGTPVTDFLFSSPGTAVTSTVSVVTDSGPNPQRRWQCIITTTTGQTYEQDSAPWTEADAIVSPILCKGVPAGQVAARMQIIEHGGGADQVVWDQPTSAAYRDWLSKYPECANGSCPLIVHELGQSCFQVGVGCDGWINDPDRDTDYSCTWGTHPIPLNECFPYGNVFNPADQANGFVYSNPSNGAAVPVPTGPTDAQRLVKDWISRLSTKRFAALPVSDRAAYLAAAAALCLSGHSLSVCQKEAMWFPGKDVAEVAEHDLDAIALGQPFELSAMTEAAKAATGVTRKWYKALRFSNGLCAGLAPTGKSCDEYPYYSTAEGGPASAANPLDGDLRYLLKSQNSSEGAQRANFYDLCGLTGPGSPGKNFIVVPDPEKFPTFGICAP